MAKREIIKIDEEKCDGCGLCIPACPEGALQIIDGKARLISDLFCDGLGACIGECPQEAIEIEKREAEPYDERKAMENIIPKGENTIKAHLKHLLEHGENKLLKEANHVLEEKGIENPLKKEMTKKMNTNMGSGGCPGARVMSFNENPDCQPETKQAEDSMLRQWPVQLHLVPATAPYFKNADVVLAADCVAYSRGDFHSRFLKDKALAIACPKLDSAMDVYQDKLLDMVDKAEINTLTVITMKVPCCNGLLMLAQRSLQEAERKVPLKHITVGVDGRIISEEWK